MPAALAKVAFRAGPPSPPKPQAPVPAKVEIMPVGETTRTALLASSDMYTPPSRPAATPLGLLKVAAVAGPPSPEFPQLPFPAIVVMMPPGDTLRILRATVSAI